MNDFDAAIIGDAASRPGASIGASAQYAQMGNSYARWMSPTKQGFPASTAPLGRSQALPSGFGLTVRLPTRASGANEMLTTCPECQGELNGHLVTASVMDASDVIEFFGGRPNRDTVNEWFGSRVLHGFRLPGIRGWLITVEQFRDDVAAFQKVGPRKRAAHVTDTRMKEVVTYGQP